MTDEMTEGDMVREVVRAWKLATPFLEAERAERIRNANIAEVLRHFDGLILPYIDRNGYRTTSGLEIMQQIFQKHRGQTVRDLSRDQEERSKSGVQGPELDASGKIVPW